jgi:hypothetical protein
LSVTGRSERCRSGSEISRAGLYQRQGAKWRCRSVEGGWLLNDLIFSADTSSCNQGSKAKSPSSPNEKLVRTSVRP